MRLAICNETFQDWPFEQAFRYAAQLGYEGLEIAPFTLNTDARAISPQQRSEVRRLAEAAGLEIIGLHWLLAKTSGYYLTTPDAVVRQRTAEYLGVLAELCRDLGGQVMVLGSPQQRNLLPGVTHEQALELAADCLRKVVPTLERLAVTLAVEPLGPQDGNFLLTAQQGRELCQRVDSPFCRLHLDCKAMASEGRPIQEIIREHADVLAHFHANDPNRRGPGMGELDFVPILRTLKEIGYRGWVSVEVFDYAPGVEALAGDSIRYLRQCLKELGE
jgi:sugar phosphate isomerase/epimerase